jgi:hypothetical protein
MTHEARATRYPSAEPFADTQTEAENPTFFGRETEADDLLNQILSNRFLVLYGASGLGKTSLLQAKIFPRLRKRNGVPLPIRMRQAEQQEKVGLLKVCWEEIEKTCKDQMIDYTPGEVAHLWEFFKTAIFWKKSDLQEPVLVFDQFEEIFNAYDREQRRDFARELGELLAHAPPDRIRSRRAAGEQVPYTDAPPTVRVVLSLREDYFGQLEEFSEDLPGIMRSRFRLLPLVRERAERAVTEPARLDSGGFLTPPFDYTEPGLKQLLDLSAGSDAEIEPLVLQVLCSQIEQKMADRQHTLKAVDGEPVPAIVGPQDLRGLTLQTALIDFYRKATKGLRRRKHVRELCSGLISSDRRRLLVEGRNLLQTYHVPQEVLNQLVNKHIIRRVGLGDFHYA